MNEQWNDVVGFEGAYQVSNGGRVRRVARSIMRSNGAPNSVSSRFMNPWVTSCGYNVVGLYPIKPRRPRRPYHLQVHRLVLEAFVGPCPEGHVCRHLNGNPADNRVENLAWGTPKQNSEDRTAHGRGAQGSKSYGAKITEAVVPIIRYLVREYPKWGILTAVGELYGLTAAGPYQIMKGEQWSHVPEVVWGVPVTRGVFCPHCDKDTDHNTRAADNPDFDFRECQACRGFCFKAEGVFHPAVRGYKASPRSLDKIARGEATSQAKITEADVREIRRLRAERIAAKDVANKFGITPSTVSAIIRRRSWKHVE